MNITHLSLNHCKCRHHNSSKLLHYYSKVKILDSHLFQCQQQSYKVLITIIESYNLLHLHSKILKCYQQIGLLCKEMLNYSDIYLNLRYSLGNNQLILMRCLHLLRTHIHLGNKDPLAIIIKLNILVLQMLRHPKRYYIINRFKINWTMLN